MNRSGWISGVRRLDSPHFDDRPDGEEPSVVVIHFISLPAGEFGTGLVEDLFMGRLLETERSDLSEVRGLRVSSHFFIDRKGGVLQFVDVFKRAWHAGLSNFRGRCAVNDFSIGIELEGTNDDPFEDAQYEALGELLQKVSKVCRIKFATGHSTIAPGRKIDPGRMFDWDRCRALLPEGAEAAVSESDSSKEMIEARMRELETSK